MMESLEFLFKSFINGYAKGSINYKICDILAIRRKANFNT